MRQTETAVIDLQNQLSVYEKNLMAKQSAADEKLKRMLVEQKEAENKRELSLSTQKILE